MENTIFYVQETIDNIDQNPVFCGTLDECEEYFAEHHLAEQWGWSIVSEENLNIDYL